MAYSGERKRWTLRLVNYLEYASLGYFQKLIAIWQRGAQSSGYLMEGPLKNQQLCKGRRSLSSGEENLHKATGFPPLASHVFSPP
jgi:hypothetical protein